MPSIFMGSYPSRSTRAPSVLVHRSTALSLTATTPPALETFYSTRACGASATAQMPASLTVSAARSVTLGGSRPTTQLATLPMTLLTHVVLWRQARTCCTSAMVAESMLALLSVAFSLSSSSSAAAALSCAVTPASLAGYLACPLHTARRHYGSTASQNGAEAAGDAPLCPLPSFAEIHTALKTLRLVTADGLVVRAWTAAEVKRAYRALAKELHPDVAGGDTAGMEHVNAAYACLISLPAEVEANYKTWLETGGEAAMLAQDRAAVPGLQRWVSRDVMLLMMAGWCATFSGLAVYASWRFLCDPPARVSTEPGTGCAVGTLAPGAAGRGGAGKGRLTLPRAGAALLMAPGVQYGVVSSGGAFFTTFRVPLERLERVHMAVSCYALAVAVTVAACVNTLMIQRVLTRFFTSVA